jgi:hypothetical protein
VGIPSSTHPASFVDHKNTGMKSILLLFSATLFVKAVTAQGVDWKQLELKGKIKSMKTQETYRYKPNGVWTEWEKTYSRTYLFDNTGRTTTFEEMRTDGTAGYKIVYKNKPKDKKIELAFFDKDGNATSKKTHVLDDKGRLLEEISYNKEGAPDQRYVYTYDDKGNRLSMTGYKADGSVSSKTSWTYDNKGKPASNLVETPGYANSSQEYTYDDKGNRTSESWYDGKKQLTFRFAWTYDANGNRIEESKYRGDKFLSKTSWKHEYDKAGNWIKKTQYSEDGIDFWVVERAIVYY